MNTENSNESLPQPVDDAAPKPGTPRRTGGGMVWLAFLLSLTAVGLGAYACMQLFALRSDTTVADRLRQFDSRFGQLQQRTESLGESIVDLQRMQAANAETLRTLASNIAIDNVDLAVAEVEQLVIMAIHNLTLQRDVKIALAALEAADRRLAGMDIPGLQATREQLAADINALRSVNAVDITGLSLYLADLSNRVTRLPLNPVPVTNESEPVSEAVDAATRPAWQRLLLAVWHEFRGMFVITRTGGNAQATLLPDQAWFLYQSLRLQLETAKLAVVRHDTETLRSTLQQMAGWLRDYFDTSDGGVANILQATEKMSAVDLAPALPDISSSLETLRAFIRSRTQVDAPAGPGAP